MYQCFFQMQYKLFKSLWQERTRVSNDSIRIIIMQERVTDNDMGIFIPLSPPGSNFTHIFIVFDSIDFAATSLPNQECQNASFTATNIH